MCGRGGDDFEERIERMIRFLAGGFGAPGEGERQMMRIGWILVAALPLGGGRRAIAVESPAGGRDARRRPRGTRTSNCAAEALKQAESRSAQARASLLPDISGTIGARNQMVKSGGAGTWVQAVPIPGFSFPRTVGPFTTMDARVNATQTVFDFSSFRRLQASKVGVTAAKSRRGTGGRRGGGAGGARLLTALKGDADVEAAEANVALAEAVVKQAENQKAAGTGTGIEITRAKVQLANDRQRLWSRAEREAGGAAATAARDRDAARHRGGADGPAGVSRRWTR